MNEFVERRVELITNALLHLPIRGAELQFAARQVELALRPEEEARISELQTEVDTWRRLARKKSEFIDAKMGEWETAQAEVERLQSERKAVITLLYTDDVFVGSHWENYPNAADGLWPQLCANAWSYGADAVEIPDDKIVLLAGLVDQYGSQAIQAWVCHVQLIDKPVKGNLSPNGKAALAALKDNANGQ